MKAKFKGTCKACGKSIEVGQEITWKGSAQHTACSVPTGTESLESVITRAIAETPSMAKELSSMADSIRASLGVPVVFETKASEKTGFAIAIGPDGLAHKVADVYCDVLVAPAIAPLEAKIDVMDGTSGQDRKSYSDTQDRESYTVPVDKPKRTRKPKVDIVSKASAALSRVPQNAAWYDVLTAILPHVSRVLLVGPPATGKSTTAMKVSGAKYRVTMTETTSREDLIGMFHLIDGETKWIDGPVTSAMRNGEPILVDEIDRYSPEAASLLYALIDDKPHLSLPNGDMLYASVGYKMIMTSNEGLDTLPVAVQDRIECILMASEPHEDAISDLPEALRNVTTCYYRSLSKVSIKLPTTVRRMKTLNLLLTNGLNPKLAASIVFGQHAEILSVLASMENSVS